VALIAVGEIINEHDGGVRVSAAGFSPIIILVHLRASKNTEARLDFSRLCDS
jgi:hypothetical protein